jgi:hypothetical protein
MPFITDSKEFGLESVLALLDGVIVDEIQDYMMYWRLTLKGLEETHQRCVDEVLRQHPELVDLDRPSNPDFAALETWIQQQKDVFGEKIWLRPLVD